MRGGGSSFSYLQNDAILSFLCKVIYIFHMPLFFVISGTVFQMGLDKNKYDEFLPFLFNKIRRLIVPFIFVGLCILSPVLIWLDLTRLDFVHTEISVLGCMGYEKHLWFLPALFIIMIVAWFTHKFRINIFVVLVLSALCAVIIPRACEIQSSALSQSLYHLPYFLLGMCLCEYVSKLKSWKLFVYSFIFLALNCIALKLSNISLLSSFLALSLPCGVIGILIPLSIFIFPHLQKSRVCAIILKDSFAIYLFHVMIIFTLYKFMGQYLSTPFIVLASFVISIVGSMLVAYMFRILHLQFLIGEK